MSTSDGGIPNAKDKEGISLVAFCTALSASLIVFGIQSGLFLTLRLKLARVYKPKTYLVPENERTEPPPDNPWGMILALLRFKDREIIKKCGLDSYFFLRYLQTLLVIFIPMACVIIPILVPINYVGGRSQEFGNSSSPNNQNITGLDTLAWGNVRHTETNRYWAHLVLAVCVIIWVCTVFFYECGVYVKVRQDWLTTAEHRLRASATTVLVSGIPDKWLNETSLRGLFDVFPGGIRNVWLTGDYTELLDKIKKRDQVHKLLESAQTQLIRDAKRKQLKAKKREEKAERKQSHAQRQTKAEKAEMDRREDEAAKKRAEQGQGVRSGDQQEQTNDLEQVLSESRHDHEQKQRGFPTKAVLTGGLTKVTKGIGKTGHDVFGGKHLDQNELAASDGFVTLEPPTAPGSKATTPPRTADGLRVTLPDENEPRPSTAQERSPADSQQGTVMGSSAARPRHEQNASIISGDSMIKKNGIEMKAFNNTTRTPTNLEDMISKDTVRWWQFWKPPPGGFASPVPQISEGEEFPFGRAKKQDDGPKTFGQKFKGLFSFLSNGEVAAIEYDEAYTKEAQEAQENETDAEWQKWLKPKNRPKHRVANFEWTPNWLPGLPFVNKRVDTIYWCRAELARLNLEIEADQKTPERYPLMNSAFIQFNHQVAAHMACQSVMHHVPRHMAPRVVEISPNDVLWENMAIPWWSEWTRTLGVFIVLAGMIILWTFPVAITSTISQVHVLIETFPFLEFIEDNANLFNIFKALAGVLPAVLLAVLLWLVPIVMDLLAGFKGAKTGSQKTETVQKFYFAFLFVQVFLVVTFTAGALNTIKDLAKNPTGITNALATKLPVAANYFFTYMMLQALSVSSGTMLQIASLFTLYFVAKMINSTAREKWRTNTQLPKVKWGSYFPVYTNFACIALIYCVIAPIISIFAIITFSLLWIANRYSMLYVNRLTLDTGGVLYPRAINQTFTGLYIMELCLIGLFFLVEDEHGNTVCFPQAIIMIIATAFTVIYQWLLYRSFGPLFRFLPITFEDEAALRDQAFQRAQDKRLGLSPDDDDDFDDEAMALNRMGSISSQKPYEHRRKSSADLGEPSEKAEEAGGFTLKKLNPVKGIVQGSKFITANTYGKAEERVKAANDAREIRRQKDLEAQRAIGEALYGGFADEIEDLTPEERDVLVRRAFLHSALRAKRPMVWIPRDDLGISDDEIRRTQEFSEHIWISNEGTALDSKVRVVYGRAPPDFNEVDIMRL